MFRDWEGMHHVDVGGNALFLKENTVQEMETLLAELASSPEKIEKMKTIAKERAVAAFSYRAISQKAIFEANEA